jgi:hypothetical protein
MRAVVLVALLGLAGCTVTAPVAVMGQRGDVLKGMAVGALSGGTFDVSNGALSCQGRYNALISDPAITFTTVCSDGRQGIGTAVRDSSMRAGRGTVRLDDGEVAQFLFGPEADLLRPKLRTR